MLKKIKNYIVYGLLILCLVVSPVLIMSFNADSCDCPAHNTSIVRAEKADASINLDSEFEVQEETNESSDDEENDIWLCNDDGFVGISETFPNEKSNDLGTFLMTSGVATIEVGQ